MIDFVCQLSVLRRNTIPQFYWCNTMQGGKTIDGVEIQLFGVIYPIPLQINNLSFQLMFYGIENIKDDCMLLICYLL